MDKKTEDILNRHIANWNVLFVKLHNYHWFVKGPHFFTLHEKFEELYNEAAQYIDELAERLLTLEGNPVATMEQFLDTATIKEAQGENDAKEMVKKIVEDLSTMNEELKEDIQTMENDEPTQDMLIGIRSSVEKHLWMLKAFLLD